MALAWALYLMLAMMGSLLPAMTLGRFDPDVFRPAARILAAVIMVGLVVLWPMLRLSQRPAGGIARGRVGRESDARGKSGAAVKVLQDGGKQVAVVPEQVRPKAPVEVESSKAAPRGAPGKGAGKNSSPASKAVSPAGVAPSAPAGQVSPGGRG